MTILDTNLNNLILSFMIGIIIWFIIIAIIMQENY